MSNKKVLYMKVSAFVIFVHNFIHSLIFPFTSVNHHCYPSVTLTPTDAAVPRGVVQSCRSIGISGAGGTAQPSVLSGPCPDPKTILQPKPPLGTSRYSYYEVFLVACLFSTVGNSPLSAP